jgi:nitronate monooxygenase
MGLSTAFTKLFGVEHPVALAPMGGSAGGALAAAVSNGGGLGLLGGGNGDPGWLARELPAVAGGTSRPWGVGFQSWAVSADTVGRALEYLPAAVMLSFGDPRPLAEPVRRAGVALILQVTDMEEARQAVDLGADVIVAQGTEAGGHSGRGWSTMAFVPAVADLAAPVPVLAAGGIADGRGLAAALALGAAGALVGTRFLATAESLADPAAKKAIIDGHGQDTERSRVLDIAPRLSLAGQVSRPHPQPPVPGAVAGPGSRAGRRLPGPAGLPGRHRPGRAPAGADLGQPGHRPHR